MNEQATSLYSLADLHRRRTSMARQRDRSTTVENVQHAEQIDSQNVRHGAQIESTVSLEALAQMDAVFKVALRLKQDRSPDAVHIARGLLHALLRLACCKAQNKPKANPEPAAVPLKLFSAGVMDKPTMRRFKRTVEAGSVGDVLACCRELFAWLALDVAARIGSAAKAT